MTKGRKPVRDEELEKTGTVLPSNLPDIELGRSAIEQQITERARQKIEGFGIELLDERFKRSKYNPAVAEKIIERMSSERHQIASKFRSEGRGEAANISGQKESDVASIQSAATRDALKIEGEADAEAARIYTAAYARRKRRNSIRLTAGSRWRPPRLPKGRRLCSRPKAKSDICSKGWDPCGPAASPSPAPLVRFAAIGVREICIFASFFAKICGRTFLMSSDPIKVDRVTTDSKIFAFTRWDVDPDAGWPFSPRVFLRAFLPLPAHAALDHAPPRLHSIR